MSLNLKVLFAARYAEWLTYRHYESWINSENPETRRLAIRAKTFGIVTFDRILRGGNFIK